MIARMVWRTLARAPRRLLVGLVGVAVPVALLAGTAFFVDTATRTMTAHALAGVQVDMQALAVSPAVDMAAERARLAAVRGVARVEPFAAVTLPVAVGGGPSSTAQQVRVFAIDPSYLRHHPFVRPTAGSLGAGVLLSDPLASATGGRAGGTVRIDLPGGRPVTLPVGGTVDLRAASTWFASTAQNNQGEVRFVPDALVIDYATFDRLLLPALRTAAASAATSGTAPGAASAGGGGSAGVAPVGLVDLESHVTLARSALASDPSLAAARSLAIRRALERTLPGQVTVADNTGDALTAASADATNAKILFLFLGIPGVLVAAALTLATTAALAAAQRREQALLRLRGADTAQVVRLAAAGAGAVGVLGSVLGLLLAAVAVTALLGTGSWRGVAPGGVLLSAVLAVLAGLAVTTLGLRQAAVQARMASVVAERRVLDRAWRPAWRRYRLDLLAIAFGLAVLAVNGLGGGLRPAATESQTLSLSFYLLLAPLALWVGSTLLGVRILAAVLARGTRPARGRQLTTWPAAALRWLGRRPGRTAATAVTGALAVAFGVNLLAFVATYDVAKAAEAAVSIGSDLRVVPAQVTPPPQPPLAGGGIASYTPMRVVGGIGVGTDRKVAYAIDPASYLATVRVAPAVTAGTGPAGLLRDPRGVLVSADLAHTYNIMVGDQVKLTVPGAAGKPLPLTLHAIGVFSTFAPTSPGADLVVDAAALPAAPGATAALPAARGATAAGPDFYLARVAAGYRPAAVAGRLTAAAGPAARWTVTSVADAVLSEQSTLATLNLHGLSRLETAGAALVAALGVAVLGAFCVLERRREFALLRSMGASTAQLLTGPALEGTVTVGVALILGVPIGLGLTTLTTRVLTPLFTLPAPLLQVTAGQLLGFVALVTAVSAVSLAGALAAVARLRPAAVLREV